MAGLRVDGGGLFAQALVLSQLGLGRLRWHNLDRAEDHPNVDERVVDGNSDDGHDVPPDAIEGLIRDHQPPKRRLLQVGFRR